MEPAAAAERDAARRERDEVDGSLVHVDREQEGQHHARHAPEAEVHVHLGGEVEELDVGEAFVVGHGLVLALVVR